MTSLAQRALGALCAVLCACTLGGLSTLAHASADHTHVRAVIDVRTEDLGAAGDGLGVYAVELVACDAVAKPLSQRGQPHAADPSLGQMLVESMFALLSGTAYANHRERFDGPSAREFIPDFPLAIFSNVRQ